MKQSKNKKNKAVFLDRDGVINKKAPEHDYIKSWADFEFVPDIIEVIKELSKNFLVVVITNQRGIAKKMLSLHTLENIHNNMKSEIEKAGGRIDGIYFCPHDKKDNCDCRKPRPGMIIRASKELDIDIDNSFMVGDSIEDIEAGKKAGCKTIFSGNSIKKKQGISPDFLAKNISDIVKIIY